MATSASFAVDMALNANGVAKGAKDAEKSLDKLKDVVEDIGKDGARDAERLEKALKDVQRQSERTDDSLDDIRSTTERSMDKSRENVNEFKSEAKQNFSEVASSFSGDMSSATDLVQGTLGGLASSIPGIGLLAGGAAVAVGGIAAAFKANDEAAEESRQRASEWADAYIESGGRVLTSTITTAKALEVITDPDQFKQAEKNAKDWGVNTAVAVAAMAGETWALAAAQEGLAERQKTVDDLMESQQVNLDGTVNGYADLYGSVKSGTEALDLLNGEMATGQQQAATYSDYLRLMAENTAGATAKVDEFGDTIYSLPDGDVIYIDAETGQATKDTEAIEKKIYSVKDKSVNVGVTTTVSSAQNTFDRFISGIARRNVTVNVRARYSGNPQWDGG